MARKVELDRLLPLVRFPLMKEPAMVMQAEPLVVMHSQAFTLLLETHQEFAKSTQAAECPRLIPRKGTRATIDLSWMCITDRYQGFKKLTHFPTLALAVSRSNTWKCSGATEKGRRSPMLTRVEPGRRMVRSASAASPT